ncbi:MAG: heme-binding protein [Gammaproteobacteria bacterium]|nr:heme-binding protein [Gammaproteobacteria bacterium]
MAAATVDAVEKLGYQLIETHGKIEVRQYEAYTVAQVAVAADFEDAGNLGFRRLFTFIDGGNSSTTPISMTAPVLQAPAADAWRVAFVMPAALEPDTMPQPIDEDVVITTMPATLMAAIRYSGNWSKERYEVHERQLRDAVARTPLHVCGEPSGHATTHHSVPTFWRRNEVLVPVCR